MVCGGLWWFVVVCGGLWWSVVVCGGLSGFRWGGLRWSVVTFSASPSMYGNNNLNVQNIV